MIGKPARAKTCPAIQGIVEEGKEVMSDFAETDALDAGLIAAAQAVEHYEISAMARCEPGLSNSA
jgi:ferritin-like metal-binding protein YciE